ncbi:DUF2442 domain-containing protein [Cohnella laeviribosi]|uniref:DUF2442 domain-containing protein n=1 Tax=Cohnella laeviribosi TaxID=380174 RepID=UPI000A067836|nr:DUF2442 domain-containing protein [Cohnella laeviribosi]
MMHEIRSTQPVEPFHLVLEFNSGEYRIVDIRPFLKGPVFEPLKNERFFKQVKVDRDAGTVVWPGDIDLDPDVLYEHSKPYLP